MTIEKGLELIGAMIINFLAALGLGAISLVTAIDLFLGEVEIGDLVG
jgi:hypothetical protein